MQRSQRFWVFVGVLAGSVVGLQAQLAPIVQRAVSSGVRMAVYAVELDSQRVVYAHRATALQKPASNQKVLTMAGVLEGLGQDYEFVTRFRLRAGVLEVLASGDPNWNRGGACDPVAAFGRVARALRTRGATAIRGVRLVAGPFTGPDRPAGWTRSDAGRHYGAATGGLVLEAGCFRAQIRPGSGPNAAVTLIAPAIHAETRGRLALTNNRKKGGLYHLALNGGALRVSGHYYRRAGSLVVTGIVDDPALVYRLALVQTLRRSGIRIDPNAPTLSGAVHEERSTLRSALARILKASKNHPTEQCLRVLGVEKRGDGSFKGSLAALRVELQKLATLPVGLVLDDGSGLSHDNRVTAKLLVDVLCAVARRPYRSAFIGSLSVGGVDGTLKKRFKTGDLAGRVRGKTGTISGVSTLSGLVQTPAGNLRAFAILMERVGKKGPPATQMRRWQDEITAAIARARP